MKICRDLWWLNSFELSWNRTWTAHSRMWCSWFIDGVVRLTPSRSIGPRRKTLGTYSGNGLGPVQKVSIQVTTWQDFAQDGAGFREGWNSMDYQLIDRQGCSLKRVDVSLHADPVLKFQQPMSYIHIASHPSWNAGGGTSTLRGRQRIASRRRPRPCMWVPRIIWSWVDFGRAMA